MLAFSREEIRDIIVAIVFLTLIFSFNPLPRPGLNLAMVLPALLVVVTAFLFHELAHKYMGIRYGCEAYFKLWPKGLFIGLISMFLPIKFVAPGATVINPYKHGRWAFKQAKLTVHELGMIAFVGPLVNIIFSLIFLPFSSLGLFNLLSKINAWLAFFNLLPIPPLDGSKVMVWNNWLWLGMIIVSGALTFLL